MRTTGIARYSFVDVRKPLVRQLTPLLRPLFAWNHRWAMQRGQRRIVEHVAARAAVAVGTALRRAGTSSGRVFGQPPAQIPA